MAAYLIAVRESPVRDAAAMADYNARAGVAAAAFTFVPHVIYGAIHPVEGAPYDGIAVLEFPDVATARAFYDSPAYQDAATYRHKAADYRMIIAEGFAPPV